MARNKQYAPSGFFDRFKIAYEATGASVREITEACCMERKAIWLYINEKVVPPLTICYEVSKRSGYSIDWMCNGGSKTMSEWDSTKETAEEKKRRSNREKTNAEIVQIAKAGRKIGKSYGQMVAEAEMEPWPRHKVINGKVVRA